MRAEKAESRVVSGVESGFGEKKDLILFLALLKAHLEALVIVTAPTIESAPTVKIRHGCHLLGSDFLKNINAHLTFWFILTEDMPRYERNDMEMRLPELSPQKIARI